MKAKREKTAAAKAKKIAAKPAKAITPPTPNDDEDVAHEEEEQVQAEEEEAICWGFTKAAITEQMNREKNDVDLAKQIKESSASEFKLRQRSAVLSLAMEVTAKATAAAKTQALSCEDGEYYI